MNIRMTEKFVNISHHVNDPKLEGFYMESFGNCITARRINRWQFDVITESHRGTENLYPAQSVDAVLNRVADMLEMDELAEYIAHFAATKWSETQIDKFMNTLCCKLCHPGFYGFQLTADKKVGLNVHRHTNRMEWMCDGKVTDFSGVVRKTREVLNTDFMWEFAEL